MVAIWIFFDELMSDKTIIVIACPNQGEGTDPEALELAFHHQGPTFINAYCQATTNLIDGDRWG